MRKMKSNIPALLKRALGYLVSPFAFGLLVTFAITLVAVIYYGNRHRASKEDRSVASFIQQIHEKTLDWRLTDRGPVLGSPRVAILAVDDRSIQQEGRWPWPRDRIAALTDRALEFGAKVIAFDMIFSEPDSNSSIPTLLKMRRELRDKGQLDPKTNEAIEQEIGRSDLDKTLRDIVKKRADHLVMGTFHEHLDLVPPFADSCIDVLFGRRAESRYWKKQSERLETRDESRERTKFPEEFTSNLDNYFTMLEVWHSNLWFEKNPHLPERILYSLDEMGSGIPKEALPGIAVYWLNNDLPSAVTILEQLKPAIATPEGAARFYERFGSAFTKQEAGELAGEIHTAGQRYCERFFTEEDELKNEARFKKLWGEGPEASAQYADFAWASFWPKVPASFKAYADETLPAAVDRVTRHTLLNLVPHHKDWVVNIPLIGDVAKNSGYFNAFQDTDGTIRRGLLVSRRGNTYMPSLAFATFLVDKALNAHVDLAKDSLGQRGIEARVVKTLEIRDSEKKPVMRVPVDQQGFLMVNYAGPANMFPHVSAADILSDRPRMTIERRVINPKSGKYEYAIAEVDKREFLKDKLLIAGVTAQAVFDLRVTPFEENYPGVETHANILSNLLTEYGRLTGESVSSRAPGFLRVHPYEERIMIPLLLVGGILLSGLLSYFGSVLGLLVAMTFLGLIYVVDKFVLFRSGVAVTVVLPLVLVMADFIAMTFYKYFTEERTKRELKGTFEKYVSPSIVAEVLADPSNIELGGKKVEMTVMFSDVRGFTTISEKLDPRELSNLLNSYLTPMTDLVFKNKGTLDKYMGDAIMAFWGAPIHFPDHASAACRCALQMLTKLRELQAEYRAKGLPEIDIGIGLNTGDMSVGNMGSDTVRSYTVMGDAVNLGSRLEGINKEYGTRIIISEFTRRAIGDPFVTREVDWVKVKGKNEPVRIFELVAERQVDETTRRALEFFDRGFALYHERKFREGREAFREALSLSPGDKCAKLYVQRCEDYLEEAPPADWDGVFTMKTK